MSLFSTICTPGVPSFTQRIIARAICSADTENLVGNILIKGKSSTSVDRSISRVPSRFPVINLHNKCILSHSVRTVYLYSYVYNIITIIICNITIMKLHRLYRKFSQTIYQIPFGFENAPTSLT